MKRKNKNKGMTLVEVLIAMTVLTVASLAIFSAFISSAQHNRRAKEKQRAMNLAQSVMESCKAYDISDIARQFNNYDLFRIFQSTGTYNQEGTPSVNSLTGEFTPSADNNYQFSMTNVNYDGQVYDVKLDFSPDVTLIPSSGVAEANAFNAYNDAIFLQDKHEINCVYKDFMDKFFIYVKDLYNWTDEETKAHFLANIPDYTSFVQKSTITITDRKLTVNISESSGISTVNVQVDYTYRVDGFKWLNKDKDEEMYSTGGTETVSVTSAINPDYAVYNNTNTLTQGARLNNVYLYYFPLYDDDTVEARCMTDEIVINNGCATVENIYLVKQVAGGYNGTTLETVEVGYKPQIYLNGSTSVSFYHNLNVNLGKAITPAGFTDTCMHNSGSYQIKTDFAGKKARVLVFKVKVHVIQNGQEVFVLDGSINSK